MDLVRSRDPIIPLKAACAALEVPRSTIYRRLGAKPGARHGPRAPNPRRIPDEERTKIAELMHSERFIDQAPRQIYAELLDEQRYVASVRTLYRVLAERQETRERRNQRKPKHNPIPRLVATKPNEVWTWDISKLPTHTPGTFLNLYLILDLFSRYPVAWMVAERENSALAKQLVSEAYVRHEIKPEELTLHNDRGAPMTALGFIELLAELHVSRSVSRPRVSNDNPFSESCFKTVKGQPDYPGRFVDVAHARRWCTEFFTWYADDHRHSGLALFTPADVFFQRVPELAAVRQAALDSAYNAHPERFVNGPPRVKLPQSRVTINPLDPGDDLSPACVDVMQSKTASQPPSVAPAKIGRASPGIVAGENPLQSTQTF